MDNDLNRCSAAFRGQSIGMMFFLWLMVPLTALAAPVPDVSLPVAGEGDSIGNRGQMTGDRSIFKDLKGVLKSGGSVSDGRHLLEKLRRDHPGSILLPKACLVMAEILEKRAPKSSQEIDRRKRMLSEAERDLWRAREESPSGPFREKATDALARLYVLMQRESEARGIMELALRENPDSPYAIDEEIFLASSDRRVGTIPKAERILSRVGVQMENSPQVTDGQRLEYLYAAGGVALDAGHLNEAGEYYKAAIHLSPDYAYAHPEKLYDLGLYSDHAGHNHRAFTLFRDYIRRSPGGVHVPMAAYHMAELSGRLGRPESRLARLKEVMVEFRGTEAADFARISLMKDRLQSLSGETSPSGRLNVLSPHIKSLEDRMIEASGRLVRKGASVRTKVDAASILVPLLVRQRRYPRALRIIHRLEIDADPESLSGKRLKGLESAVITSRILSLGGAANDRKVVDLVHSYRDLIRPVLSDPLPSPMEMENFSREGLVFLRIAEAYDRLKNGDHSRRWFHRVLLHGGLSARTHALSDLVRLDRQENRTLAAWNRGQELLSLIQKGHDEQAGWLMKEERIARAIPDPDREIPLLRRFVHDFPADPKAGWAEARLFQIYRQRNEFMKAENSAEKALVLMAPGSSDQAGLLTLLDRYGQMEASLHRTQKAISLWEMFLKEGGQDPRRGWVMYQIGKIEEADGNGRRAYQWYLRASKVASSPELASVARQKAQGVSIHMDGRGGS